MGDSQVNIALGFELTIEKCVIQIYPHFDHSSA
jgi:hypothetical protein